MKTHKLLTAIIAVIFTGSVFAQDINEAGKAFNDGQNSYKQEHYEGAVDHYKQCISLCEQIGSEADDLEESAQKQLATTYYKMGADAYGQKKYDRAIERFKNSLEYAELTGDNSSIGKAQNMLCYAYTSKGNLLLKDKVYEEAVKQYTTAIDYKPDYYKAYYGLGIAQQKLGNEAEMKEALTTVIENGSEEDKNVKKSKSAMAKYYYNAGAKALQDGDNAAAISSLSEAINYNSKQFDVYYYLTLAHNNLKQWDDAIAVATKGLTMKADDKANLYFELGRAFEGKDDKIKACENYKKVKSGPNVEVAKYQITTVLKCN